MNNKTFLLQAVLLALAILAALVCLPDNLSGKNGLQQANAKSEDIHIQKTSSVQVSGEGKTSPKKEPQKALTKAQVKDYPYIIACRNQVTGEIKKPINPNPDDGWCFYGKNWKNLMFPSKAQMKDLKSVYWNRSAIVTALTLINHESQFDSHAKGCHNGGCDYGLFQIRDVNGWKTMSDKQQMEWFKSRKAWQLSPKGNCFQHIDNGQERLLRCVFARHNGVLDGYAKYPSDRLSEWRFYNTLGF